MVVLFLFAILTQVVCVTCNIPGGIMEIYYPDIVLETQETGNITFGSGSNGSVHLRPGAKGTVLYNDYDLLDFVKIMRGLPPVWGTPSTVGFVARYNGGDNVNITLNALDPEGDKLVYAVVSGDLPPGLVLDPHEGVIRGIAPDENALFTVTIRASDNHHKYADAVLRFETRETDRCTTLKPCQNGGECVDKNGYYECHCVGVYGGKNCDQACNVTSLGVDERIKLIPDAQLSAYRSSNQSFASDGRANGKGWCGIDKDSWLQVDLGETKFIHRVLMQGITTNLYTGKFKMMYSINGTSTFAMYNNQTSGLPIYLEMQGHTGVTDFNLPDMMEARFVRFLPISWGNAYKPCMKVDLFGCDLYF